MVKQLPIPRPGTQVVNLARGRKVSAGCSTCLTSLDLPFNELSAGRCHTLRYAQSLRSRPEYARRGSLYGGVIHNTPEGSFNRLTNPTSFSPASEIDHLRAGTRNRQLFHHVVCFLFSDLPLPAA